MLVGIFIVKSGMCDVAITVDFPQLSCIVYNSSVVANRLDFHQLSG